MQKPKYYAMRWRIMNVLIGFCLLLLLTACADKSVPPQILYLIPPESLLVTCEQAPFTGETFGDAVLYAQRKQIELEICASRLDGIINWRQNVERAQ